MKFKNLFIVTFIALIPVVLFWGCGLGTQPVAPSNSTTMTIQIPPVGAHSEFVPAAQNMILYNVSSGSSSVTGSYGPLTASGVTGQINFSIKLPTNVSTYSLISLEIVDNTTQTALAVGAASLTGATNFPVTLGPLNKTYYQVSALGSGYGYGFESGSLPVSIGANTPTNIAGIDVVSNLTSDSIGYVLENPAFTGNTVAYMGNGNFVNYLRAPTNFSIASGVSKKAVLGGGTNPVAVGDVYCLKMKAGGYVWLQITGAGVVGGAGPSFSFRPNTTLSYCGYEQSTADAGASSVHGTPTPYAPQFVLSGFTTNYVSGVAVYPSTSAATTLYVVDAGTITNTAAVHPFTNLSGTPTPGLQITGLSWPAGAAVNSTGTTLYVADPFPISPGSHGVSMYSLPSGTSLGAVGNGAAAPIPDTRAAVTVGSTGDPQYVAVAPNGNVFITDSGTNGFADVLVMQAPTSVFGNAVTYWNGQISTSTSPAGIATDGTVVYIADSGNNQIETYNINGVSGSVWTTDNNPGGTMAFSGPQGIALDSALGLLFIADTGNNRVVEMTTLGIFRAAWGTWGLGSGVTPSTMSGPTGIAVDGANPPNVYVSDSGNKRVLGFKGL